MSVWKKNGKWVAKFQHDGQQHKREGFKTRAEALAWQESTRLKLQQPTPTHSGSFHELATRYLDHCRSRMQVNTWRSKRYYFKQFIEYLGNPNAWADQITKIQVHDHIEAVQKQSGPKTANRHLKDLRAMFNWCLQHDLIKHNPARNIPPFPEQQTIRHVPPAEDIDRVLLCAGPEELDLLTVLYHTGGRIGELLRLTWEDVNFERRSIRLWTRKRRSGELEPDLLAMGDKLMGILQRRWEHRDKDNRLVFLASDGSALRYASLRNLMRDLCRRAGVKPFGFHAIRHHVASILEDSGKATLGQIQKFLRHRRKSTTENYLHGIERDLVEVAKLLDQRREKSVLVSVPLDN